MATLSGTTRAQAGGVRLANCSVYLFKYASGGNTLTQIDSGVSNVNGNYALVAADADPVYTVVAFNESGAPVLTGATVRTLTPIAVGTGWEVVFSGTLVIDGSYLESDATQIGVWQPGTPYTIDQVLKRVTVEDWSIDFRPDTDGLRQEIIVEKGSSYSHAAVDEGAYTATVKFDGATVDTFNIPRHWYHARYRLVFEKVEGVWQTAASRYRAKTATSASLITDKTLPPYGNTGVTLSTNDLTSTVPYTIMRDDETLADGLNWNFTKAGGHPYIGFNNAYAAQAVLNDLSVPGGDTLSEEQSFHWAEFSASLSMHVRDDSTRKPISVFDYPDMTMHPNESGDPEYIDGSPGNPWRWDSAHLPDFSSVPFLWTGDLFYLEELQNITNRILLNSNWKRYEVGPTEPIAFEQQERGWAWQLRNLFQCIEFSPTTDATGVLLPKSYFQTILDNTRQYFADSFVNNLDDRYAIFQAMGLGDNANGSYTKSWQGGFLAAVIGYGVRLGHTNWEATFDWKMQQVDAMLNGTSGWNRWLSPNNTFWAGPSGVAYTSWGAAYTAHQTLADPPVPATIYSPNETTDDGNLDYPSNQYAAMVMALHLGKTATFQPIHDWHLPELIAQSNRRTTSGFSTKWSWVEPV